MSYPISVNLKGRVCLVVGGGRVAERKIKSLLANGAAVCLVSPEATEDLKTLAEEGRIDWRREAYAAGGTGALDDVFLVIACTDNRTVNAEVTQEAQARQRLALCADDPDAGNFVSLAQITRGELGLTVSTGGGSPTLAAVLRERLETEFGPEWSELTALIGRQRDQIKAIASEAERKAAVRRVLDDAEVHALLLGGRHLEAEARIRQCIFLSSE